MGLILFREKPQSDCLFTRTRIILEQISNVSKVNTPGLCFVRRISDWLLVSYGREPKAEVGQYPLVHIQVNKAILRLPSN